MKFLSMLPVVLATLFITACASIGIGTPPTTPAPDFVRTQWNVVDGIGTPPTTPAPDLAGAQANSMAAISDFAARGNVTPFMSYEYGKKAGKSALNAN